MRISEKTADQAKATARIEEVVGDFVSLTPRGSNLVGLCPFHNDRTPSFYVSPAKGVATCFACGDGQSRDAIQFLRDHKSWSFNQAIEYLANRYHIPIEYEYDDDASAEARVAAKEEAAHRRELVEVMDKAVGYYEQCLYQAGHGEALEYLHGRGITDATLKVYRVGYAPREQQGMAMVQAALKSGVAAELLVDAGLAYSSEKARFINRVLFPIRRVDGRTVGFGGRILPSEPDKKALAIKYLNTCETVLYQKSHLLFGLDIAHKAINQQRRAYICEGYMDVLAMYEAGVHQAVAACGTAFTAEQARLLGKFCDTAVLCYDGDDAGAKACISAMKVLLAAGVIPEVFVPPMGSDPASLLLQHGHGLSSFIEEHTVSYLEYLVGDCTVTSSPAVYQAVMMRTAKVVACVRDAVVKDQAIRWVAQATGADLMAVEGLVMAQKKALKRASSSAAASAAAGAGSSVSSVSDNQVDVLDSIAPPTPRPAIEASIVALLKDYPCQGFVDFVREEVIEDGIVFSTVSLSEVLGEIVVDASLVLEDLTEQGEVLQDLVLLLKECVVLEALEVDGCDWEMLGEMKMGLEGLI